MAGAASDDDDDYVKLGRDITAGKKPAKAASNKAASQDDDDPYVAAGRALTAPLIANPPQETKPASRSGTGVDVPFKTGIPTLDNWYAGVLQGGKDVVATGANAAKWVNDRVPALAALDAHYGFNPGGAANALDADRKAYETSEAGNSWFGRGGRMLGGIIATAPVLGPLGGVVGAGTRAVGSALPEAAPAVNFLGRRVADVVQGAAGGGTYGALTSGGSDRPVLESVKENALAGAVLGPVVGTVGEGAGVAGQAVKGGYGYMTGKTAERDVAEIVAAARTRAVGQTPPAPEPEVPGAPAPAAPGAAAPTPGAVVDGWRRMTPGEPMAPGREVATDAHGQQWVRAAGAPTPQPGGAQASTAADMGGVNALTRQEIAAQRVRNFDLRMQQGAKRGEDWTEYVEGSRPTLAEGLGDAHLAGVQRNVLAGDQRITNWDDVNLKSRQEHIGKLSGDAVSADNLDRARASQGTQDLKTAWAGKQDTSAEPIRAHIDGVLESEAGKLKPVAAAMQEVREVLYDKAGKLETDPQRLFGVRRQISYMLSKKGRLANPAYGDEDVMRHLIETRDVVDEQILAGAPHFQTFLDNWRAASPEIDKQEFLQKFHLTDDGAMTLSKVNQMLKEIRSGLDATGPHPAQSVDDATIDRLFHLREDLLREANRKLASPQGSPTAYNQGLGAELGINAAHTGVRTMLSPIPGVGALSDAVLQRVANKNIRLTREGYIKNLLAEHAMTPPEAAPNLLRP